ncbi:hypothetical protein Sinme_6678 (plasmid) [Sinorhizobium meliloti AK83]|nr:hypothetical protein Sinme_6678 [Sinorhizobium meliloti AK83]
MIKQRELRATRQLRIRALGATGRVAEAASYYTSSQPIVCLGLPAPSCSRCLCPGCSQHTPQFYKLQQGISTKALIPVTNPIGEIKRRTKVVGNFPKTNTTQGHTSCPASDWNSRPTPPECAQSSENGAGPEVSDG